MAYDEGLADRVRDVLAGEDVTEKRMFGGLAFLVEGHMAVAVGSRGGLMLRCHPEDPEHLLAAPGASPTVMRGRQLRGWLDLDDAGGLTDEELRAWVGPAVDYSRSLP